MDILGAVESKGITLKKVASTHGGEWAGPCPLCNDGTDRFRVWPQKHNGQGGWWCRRCEKGGDLIQFYRDVDGLGYREACQAAGVEVKKYSHPKPQRIRKPKPEFTPTDYGRPAELWTEKAGKFVEECHAKLMESEKALTWLKDKRGINAATASRYRLGLNDNQKYFRPRQSWGLEKEIHKKTGKPKMLWIPRGLVIPWTVEGQVQRIKIRRPQADLTGPYSQRYWMVPGSKPSLMITADDKAAAMVVESELDAILLAQAAGDLLAVIALGTASAKPDGRTWRTLKKAKCILIALDFDEGGTGAVAWWLSTFSTAEIWPVPVGKDPGDLVEAGVDIRAWVLAGLPPAWKRGPSLQCNFEKGEALEKEGVAQKAQPPPAQMDDIQHAASLMNKSPLKIIKSPGRIRIEENPLWAKRYPDQSRKLCNMIFLNTLVRDHVFAHPDKVIDKHNFLAPGKGE